MNEGEPVKLKGHHVDLWRKLALLDSQGKLATDVFWGFDDRYHMVTTEEQQRSVQAITTAIEAIHSGDYSVIEETNPDIVCDNCFRPKCPQGHSVVDRVTHDGEKREKLWQKAIKIAIYRGDDYTHPETIIPIFSELIC